MLRTERIEYDAHDVAMIGYLARDASVDDADRPGVLLMHEGGGQDDSQRRAVASGDRVPPGVRRDRAGRVRCHHASMLALLDEAFT